VAHDPDTRVLPGTISARMSAPDSTGVGGRLDHGPARVLAESALAQELAAAPYLLDGLSYADLAHVAMLLHDGVIEPETARALLDPLVELHDTASDLSLDPLLGDLYNNRDAFLSTKLGELAGVIHTGRARREATTIAWLLSCRSRLLELWGAQVALLEVLHRLGGAERATSMPDFTYLQHAHATSLGHYLLGFAFPFLRDLDRARRALELLNRSPAGSGSVNGSQIPMDRAWVAELLGFDGVIEHTRDAMWAPDIATEAMTVVTTTMTNIDRLCEDLQIWATAEFGFVEFDDAHSRASVIMPQKKNPYALSFLRGETRNLLGRWVGVVSTSLTPSGQPDNRIFAYLDVPEAIERTTRAVRLLAEVLDRATWNRARMAASTASGYGYTTDMCDHLVLVTGLNNRTAHRVLGRAVRDALADDSAITADRLREAAGSLGIDLDDLDDGELERNRDPAHTLALRRGIGGAGPEPMDAMLADLGSRIADARLQQQAHPLRRWPEQFFARIRAIVEQTRSAT
jgi:argininosuccinate lyase